MKGACPKRTVTYCYRKGTVFDRMDLASGPMPPPREKTNLFPTILFPPGKVKLLFQTGLQEPESLVGNNQELRLSIFRKGIQPQL